MAKRTLPTAIATHAWSCADPIPLVGGVFTTPPCGTEPDGMSSDGTAVGFTPGSGVSVGTTGVAADGSVGSVVGVGSGSATSTVAASSHSLCALVNAPQRLGHRHFAWSLPRTGESIPSQRPPHWHYC